MPNLSIYTAKGTDVAANKAYVLYTLGGFRRQTAIAKKSGKDCLEWNVTDVVPVSKKSSRELDITLFEPSSFGDKHCGSCRINWYVAFENIRN